MLPIRLDQPAELIIAVAVCLLLALFTYLFKVLDPVGSILALTMGLIIWLYASVHWLIILISFMIFGFIATKFKYGYKKSMGVNEGERGMRGGYNVLASGLVPTIVACLFGVYKLYNPTSEFVPMACVVFLSAVSIGAADTFASEIGVMSNKVYWILDPRKKVEVGTDGGVSWLGQGAALFGAVITTSLGAYLFYTLPGPALGASLADLPDPRIALLVPMIMGFAGCQLDSVVGATLQKRGWLTNSSVNHVSIGIGALITMGIMLML